MRHFAIVSFLLMTACTAPVVDRAVVSGTTAGEMLKLRAGPGLEYNVILGLPEGTKLVRRGCVTELGQLWCKVSLAEGPVVTGYVSADYLSPPLSAR